MLSSLVLSALTILGQTEPPLVLRSRPPISQVEFHPDGKRVYFMTPAGVEAYDTSTGKLLFDAPGGHHLTCSPKGDRLALVSTIIGMVSIHGTIVVVDGDTGKKLHQGAGTYAWFGPDGRWMISHSGYNVGHPKTDLPPTMHITDLRSGKTHPAQIKNRTDMKALGFGEHAAPAFFQLTKDGKALVGRTRNGFGQMTTLSACDLETGKALDAIPKDDDVLPPAHDPRTSSDGKRHVANWTVFDVEQGKPIAKLERLKPGADSWSAIFQLSSDGKEVYSYTSDRGEVKTGKDGKTIVTRISHLHAWDAESGRYKGVLAEAKDEHVLSALRGKKSSNEYRADPRFVVNRQGTIAISHAGDATVTVWDLKTGKALRKMRETGHTTRPEILRFSADGKWLASASTYGEVVLWDVKKGQAIRTLDRVPNLGDLQFRLQSKELVGVGHGLISVWNFETGELKRTFERKGNPFLVEFHPDGKRIAVADHWTENVSLIDIETGETLREIRGKALSLAFHPVNKSLLTLYGNGAVTSWDVESGNKLQNWLVGKPADWQYRLHQIALLANGKQLLLRGNETLTLIDLKDGKRISEHTFRNKAGGAIYFMSLHPDGKRVAMFSGHPGLNEIVEVDFHSGKVLRTYNGQGYITQVRYSPDGTRLASTGYDYLIRLHPVPTTNAEQ